MHRESRMCHNHTDTNITLIVTKFLVIQRVRQNNINLKFLMILVIQHVRQNNINVLSGS